MRADLGTSTSGRPPGRDVFVGGGRVGAQLARVNWSATPLGPPEHWPFSLVSTVETVLRSRFSMWMAWGPELTFFCNDAYRQDTLGSKYPWALGRPAHQVWAEIWPDIGPRIEKVLATGEATWDEALLLILERSGYQEETYHTFSYSPLSDDEGQLSGMLCVVTEDTARVIGGRRMSTLRDLGSEPTAVRTEDDVLVSAARHLGDNRADLPFCLFYTLEEDGRVGRLRAASGIAPGHPAAPATLVVDDPACPWPVDAAAQGRPHLVGDLAGRFADLPTGAWDRPPAEALVLPLQQGRHAPAGFLVAALNRYRPLDDDYQTFLELVSGQIAAGLATARSYAAERDRAEQLAELDRAKTAFFANVSHEFRTPLTLLLGPVQDALADPSEPLPPRQRERVEMVQRNADRLLKLVNTLLDFSRLEAGRVEARFEPVDLARDTRELASVFASAVERAGLTLVVDCPTLSEPVWVDQDHWAKVVLNLLSNALKFTFEGGITVRLRDEGGAVELSVQDTGIGIDPDEQGHLFERFYRATAARARTHEGSGIGLALVADLAALHGGSVRVDSSPGLGSTFTVRIPQGNRHLPAERLGGGDAGDRPDRARRGPSADGVGGFIAEAQRWLGDPTAGTADTRSADTADGPDSADRGDAVGRGRPRILVIDDNADMREYVSRLLAGDYDVTLAADGPSGLRAARRRHPDLILSDVMMPGLDGFDVLAALRADPATDQIPVVLLSARAGDEATVEGLEAGADDYLVKPFTARELLARVGANLEFDRVRRTRDRLERSQVLLDQTQRLSRIGSWEVDLVDGTMSASAEMLRHLRITDPDVDPGRLSSSIRAHTHPDDAELVRSAMARTLADGTPLDVEFRVDAGDGTYRTYHTLGEVVRDADGRMVRLRGSSQDVTDQRRSERALATAAANREAAAREHRIADELQRSLVPAPSFTPDNLAVATYYRPGVEGTQVGGDWYDVIELGAGRTALTLGDVMGRGVKAAAVMGQLRAAVRAYAQLDLPPGDVLKLLDRAVRDLGGDQIVTCVYAVYDPADRTLCYGNAGHLPPILRCPGEVPRRLTGGSGPPLGTGMIDIEAEQIELPEGSLLALYTDGLVERRGSDIDVGVDRLAALIAGFQGAVGDLPDYLVARLLPEGPDDDVAVLLVSAHDQDRPSRAATFDVGHDEQAVRAARAFVARTVEGWAVAAGVADNAVLAASELVTNALVYGKPPVQLRLHCTVDHLVVQVLDGVAYLPQRMQPTLNDERGRGLQIVAQLSGRWGARPTPTGKAVWCALPITAGTEAGLPPVSAPR